MIYQFPSKQCIVPHKEERDHETKNEHQFKKDNDRQGGTATALLRMKMDVIC